VITAHVEALVGQLALIVDDGVVDGEPAALHRARPLVGVARERGAAGCDLGKPALPNTWSSRSLAAVARHRLHRRQIAQPPPKEERHCEQKARLQTQPGTPSY
jgi:hypothetical protein